MKKRRILIIAICLVCIGIVLAVVFIGHASPRATPPNTANVTRGDIVKTVLVDGNLAMPNKAYLSFGVTGTVKEVLVSEGNNVTKGQVLARLDAQSLNLSVKTAELQVEIAEAQVRAARAQYEKVQDLPGADEDAAEANWETAKLSLKLAQLNLESAKLNLEKAVIVAPLNGVVTDITIIKGEEISAAILATPAISLVDISEIEMRGFIDEIDIAMVKAGQEAHILLDSLPNEEINGSVAFISLVSTVRAGVVSYATTINLENPSEELKDGMSATAEVIIERRDDVLVIPNRAVRGTLQNPKVVVLVYEQQKERKITLGLTDGINTEVLSGLEEGEEVVLPAAQERQDDFFMM